VAGRRVKFMNDDLYDNLQTDRYHYYGMNPIPSWRQTLMMDDEIDRETFQVTSRKRKFTGNSLDSPPISTTTQSTSPQCEFDTIPGLVACTQRKGIIDTDTTMFPEFFLRFLVTLLLLPYVPPLCTWIQQSSLFTRDTIDTLTNNIRVNTNNLLGIFNHWPFKYMSNQSILPRQHFYGIVQGAKQLLCGFYQQIPANYPNQTALIATIINITTHYIEPISIAKYISLLKQSAIYSFIAIILTIFPTKQKPKHTHAKRPINFSIYRLLKYYLIVLLLTRIIPSVIIPCSATTMSSPNSTMSGRGINGRGIEGRGRGRGRGELPTTLPTNNDIYSLMQTIGQQLGTVTTRLEALENTVNPSSSSLNNNNMGPPATVSPARPSTSAQKTSTDDVQQKDTTSKGNSTSTSTQRTIPECRDYACTSKDESEENSWFVVPERSKKRTPEKNASKSSINIPQGIISSTTIPHPQSRDIMHSSAAAVSKGVYIGWWSYPRFLNEFGDEFDLDMDSICVEMNVLQRKFAPKLKAKVKLVCENEASDNRSNQKFSGHLLVVPTTRNATESDLTDIVEAWSAFIVSKVHLTWTEQDGIAAYIPALRFNINPTNSPKYTQVGIALRFCGHWIPQNDALAKRFLMHSFVDIARQQVASGPLLALDTFWKCSDHLGLNTVDSGKKGRGDTRLYHLIVCCTDDDKSRRICDAFFAAFRGTTNLPREIHVFGLLPIKFILFPSEKNELTRLYRLATEELKGMQLMTFVHLIRINKTFFHHLDNITSSIRAVSDLLGMIPRYTKLGHVGGTLILKYGLNVRTKSPTYYEKILYAMVPASQPTESEVIVIDDDDDIIVPKKKSKFSPKEWDAMSTWTNTSKLQHIGVRFGIGGPRAIGVFPFDGKKGAKSLTHGISYGMENCKGFDTNEEAWRWVAEAWPGVTSFEKARELVWSHVDLNMTNLDIRFFKAFHISSVPPGKTAVPYWKDDDEELVRSRSFCTFGHQEYDPACARYIFDRFGVPNAFRLYEESRKNASSVLKSPPRLNSNDFPPLSVQYPSPPTGDNSAPAAASDDRKLPATTTHDDTNRGDDGSVSQMSVEQSVKNMKGLSLEEEVDNDNEEDEEPQAKKPRGQEDVVMDAEPENVDANEIDIDEQSKSLLSEDSHDDTVVPSSQPPPASQTDRHGLVILGCPEYTTVTDATFFLEPYLAAQSENTVVALCEYQGRFGILVTGASLLVTSLGNSLNAAEDLKVFRHAVEVETLDFRDWDSITPISSNANAERLSTNMTVQSCKAQCPPSQSKPFATAIANASTADDVFNFFVGLLTNAKSNDSGTASRA